MVTYPGDIIGYSEIKNIYKRVKGTPITAEKMHKIKSATGTIRVFAGGATEIKANVSDLPNANIINVPVVIVQSRGVIDFIYCNEPCTFKNEMWGYTSSDAYAVKFLFYYLKHNVDYFRNAGDGRSSFSQISLPVTEEYKIPLIPSKEQQTIASILSDFDEHIDNLTELIEKKKAIRDGALEDLVSGKTRLDGFSGEWESQTINDFIKIKRGASPRPIESYLTNNSNGINWIKIGDAPRYGKYIESTKERITPSGANHSVMVFPDDFLLSNSMSFGRPYILKAKGCIHDGWLRLYDFQEKADKDFLFYLLSTQNVQSRYTKQLQEVVSRILIKKLLGK